MGLIYNIGVRLMNFMIFYIIIILLPGVPPRTTFPFTAFTVTPARELKGALELNYHLEGAEKILAGRVYGPEHLLARKNEIYTGIYGGEVIKLTADHVTHVAKFGQPCEDIFEEARCGRPLGLAFDTLGNNLIVADAYYGIWEVDLSNGKKKLLVSPQQELDGKIKRKAKTFNSVAVGKKGDIYWTDSSSDYAIEDLIFSIFGNPSGRLFHYDRVKNESTCLLDELFFANGLALAPNEDFIVVAETGASRLTKYHLKGPQKGKHEVFTDGLPGTPDNLTPDSEGIWIPLITAKDADHPSAFAIFSQFPMIRLFLSRMLALFELPFRVINNAYPNTLTQKFIHSIGHVEVAMPLMPKRSTIVRVDWNGNILGSLHGFDKSVGYVSHVLQLEDHLLLGSPYNRFIAKVKLPKSHQVKVRNVRYEGANIEPVVPTPKSSSTNNAQPTTTARPPTTTTTPKPTTTTPAPKPSTTTTPKPTTTTQKPTTTTQKPTTTTQKPTTTTQKPITTTPKPTTTTTPKPTSTTSAAPKPVTPKPTPKPTAPKIKATQPPSRTPPKDPAPIVETIPEDTQAPPPAKLKIIKKGGEHGEL